MRATRLVVLGAILAFLAWPATAHAATITQSFSANSGDACRYGTTEGALGWRYGTTSPLPVLAVDVKGKLTDRPLPTDPATTCRDDGYYSMVTFAAYSGSVLVERQSRTANNSVVTFEFTLGLNSTTNRISRVVIQVCRSPLYTLPPSYCGAAVEYLAPPIA